MSDRAKIGAGLLAVAAAIVLFVVLQGDDDSSEPAAGGQAAATPKSGGQAGGNGKPKPAPVPTIRLEGGEPVGGVQEVEATSGERVRFRVLSDTEGEVHVHGYDDEKEVSAGGKVEFDFPATLEGGFEIELHHGAGESQIGELKVQPG